MHVGVHAIAGITPGALDKLLPFQFQVPPLNSMPINRSYPWSDYDPIEGGQRSRRGSLQLQTYSWRTLFTADVASWTLLHGEGFTPNPLEMIDRLDLIARLSQRLGVPIFLTARHPKLWSRYDVSTPATLRSLNSEEVEGEWDTRYVDVQFVQWRDTSLQAKQMSGGSRSSRLPVTLTARALPEGQRTMYDLAAHWYTDPTEWVRIAKENGLGTRAEGPRVGPSLDLRFLGERKITVPRRG